jgi:hypothetical protein
MTYEASIKFAPISTLERINDVSRSKDRILYDRGSLEFFPNRTCVPLLIDHDESQEIGRVNLLLPYEDTDGPWLCASAEVKRKPSWLGSGTGASFG